VTDGLFKLEGAGNDFLFGLGTWARRLAEDPELVRRLCRRRRGIGADGAVGLTVRAEGELEMAYRNADGSLADFCANATRCAARAGVVLLDQPSRLEISTGWTGVGATVDDVEVHLELPAPAGDPIRAEIEIPDAVDSLWQLTVGVPHLVVPVADVASLDLPAVAPLLRFHPTLGPGGANVTFFAADPHGTVRVRSWERGVEDETLCCGSGVVAVALVLMAGQASRRVELIPASGDRLSVAARGQPPRCPTRCSGPARLVARIEPAESWQS
jgi:diaminopimelate epimerase